jgi:hypothetical protein
MLLNTGVAPDYAVRHRYFHGEKIFMAQTLLRGNAFFPYVCLNLFSVRGSSASK